MQLSLSSMYQCLHHSMYKSLHRFRELITLYKRLLFKNIQISYFLPVYQLSRHPMYQ